MKVKNTITTISKNIIQGDKKISIIIMSSFVILSIQYLILIYFQLIGTSLGQLIQLLSKIIIGFFYLSALLIVLRRNKIKFLGIYLIAIIIFAYNLLFFPKNWEYLKLVIFPLFFTCLPSFIYAYSIDDQDILMSIMEKASKIVFVVGLILSILVFIGKSSVGSYSMVFSYYMLLPSIIYLNKLMESFSFKYVAYLITLLFIILSLGARGPVLCIGVFVMLKIMKLFNKITLFSTFAYIAMFFVIIIGFIYKETVLIHINDLFLNMGISSRTLTLLIRKDIYLSGREELYKTVLDSFYANPILGIGLAGDRVILEGTYAHNIFLELLAHFGFVAGLFIIVAILYIFIKDLFVKDRNKYDIFIIWLAIGFIPLFISGSYLLDSRFWILLGLSSKILKTDKGGGNYHSANSNIHVSIQNRIQQEVNAAGGDICHNQKEQ